LNSCGTVRTVTDLNLSKIFVLTYGPDPAEAWNLVPQLSASKHCP